METPKSSSNEPYAFSFEDITKLTSIHRTKLYSLVAEGQLKARKVGKRTVILARDLHSFLNALPASIEVMQEEACPPRTGSTSNDLSPDALLTMGA